MALSARELVLIIRARDEASRAINAVGGNIRALGNDSATAADKLVGIGSALLTIGTAMAGAGAIGTGFFDGAIDGAIEYSKAAALTLTQTGNVNTSLEELKQIGIDVSREVPVAMGDIQQSLFDIFSTIDTDVPGATNAVREFAKAAVAGDADISSVSRTTLAALNAWQLPVEDTTKLLDTQFRLVELGAGTYQEFAQTMGLSIPTAVAAGQSFDTMSGALAFLTRQGLTTNRAVTSTGRAFELLTQPKVVRRLEGIGVSVTDASGNFRQMDDIITQLAVNKGWAQMTDPQRKKAFKEIFGTGSIQARRFFDVAIPNYEQFNDLTDQMRNSSGAMDRAYQIMFDEPASKVQLLSNEYAAIKQEIGEQLIPAKLKLMETVQRLFDAWNSLSPELRATIVKYAALAAAALLVIGPIVAMVGAFLMFIGIVAPLVGGVGALAAIFGWVLLAIAAVILIGWLLIENWDLVKSTAESVWQAITDAFGAAKDFIIPIVEAIWAKLQEWWNWLLTVFVPGVVSAWNGAVEGAVAFRDVIVGAAQAVWDKLQEWWNWLVTTFGPGLSQIWTTLVEEFGALRDEFGETVDYLQETAQGMADFFGMIWSVVVEIFKFAMDQIWSIISPAVGLILALFRVFGPTIVDIVKIAFDLMKSIIINSLQVIWDTISAVMLAIGRTLKTAWDLFVAIVTFAIRLISNIIQLVMNVIQGDWRGAWDNVKNILKATWDLIKAVVRAAVEIIWNLLRLFGTVAWSIIRNMGSVLVSIVKNFWNLIKAAFRTGKRGVEEIVRKIPGVIKGIFSNAGSLLVSAGKKIITGLIDGISSKFRSLKNKLGEVTNLIPDWKGPGDVDRKLLFNSGQMIMGGLEKGLEDGWGDVRSFLTGLTTPNSFSTGLTLGQDTSGSTLDMVLAALGSMTTAGLGNGDRVGLKVEGDLVLGSADDIPELDFWSQKKASGV